MIARTILPYIQRTEGSFRLPLAPYLRRFFLAMATEQNILSELVGQFADFERKRSTLAGLRILERALACAEKCLLDKSKEASHDQIRRLVATWFERVVNWQHLAHQRNPNNYESTALHARSVELFNDPLFCLPSGAFDDDGWSEVLSLLLDKPVSSRTSIDSKRISDLFKRMNQMRAIHKAKADGKT